MKPGTKQFIIATAAGLTAAVLAPLIKDWLTRQRQQGQI